MLVNVENAKEEFLRYIKMFDLNNENIQLKQKHSLRVMQVSKNIAEKLNLSEEKIEIATLIGLLHDIARFEQYTKYNTFRDLESIDHGDYGVKILDKEIRKYIQTDKYDEIIKKAIKNHNKLKIEEELTKEEKLFVKIIRDADKIDIFFEGETIFWKGIEDQINKSEISDNILKHFKNNQLIERKKNDNNKQDVDKVLGVIAFIFDINYKGSFEIIKEKDYINKILDRFEFKDKDTERKIKEIKEIANNFINKNI